MINFISTSWSRTQHAGSSPDRDANRRCCRRLSGITSSIQWWFNPALLAQLSSLIIKIVASFQMCSASGACHLKNTAAGPGPIHFPSHPVSQKNTINCQGLLSSKKAGTLPGCRYGFFNPAIASFISSKCVCGSIASVTWTIFPSRPMRKLTRRDMLTMGILAS